MILVDGRPASQVPADDRGLTYGDGVFRTLAMRQGRPVFWSRQAERLAADCTALGIHPPDAASLRADLALIAATEPDCAVRITVTRGSGGHGYALPAVCTPRRIVSTSPLPRYPADWATRGVALRYCALRLAAQPQLAGIKHLNRLENVLARREWQDPAVAEGLLLDAGGAVIEGTRCNLFIVEDGALLTPDLTQCGVAGITRDLVRDGAKLHGWPCRVDRITPERLEAAAEVFLVNSLIDAWPVATLGTRRWDGYTVTPLVRKWLDALRDAPD